MNSVQIPQRIVSRGVQLKVTVSAEAKTIVAKGSPRILRRTELHKSLSQKEKQHVNSPTDESSEKVNFNIAIIDPAKVKTHTAKVKGCRKRRGYNK